MSERTGDRGQASPYDLAIVEPRHHAEGGQADLSARDLEARGVLPLLAANLRRLRTRKGYSLERLSRLAGVSRAMLGQIEQAKSAPTVNVLWRVASALSVPFAALLGPSAPLPAWVSRARGAARLTTSEGFASRPLFPFGQGPRPTEFYELRLAPLGFEHAKAHPAGSLENLVVTSGSVVIEAGGERHVLEEGDAILFHGDVEHSYKNPSDKEAVMYLVMTYASDAG